MQTFILIWNNAAVVERRPGELRRSIKDIHLLKDKGKKKKSAEKISLLKLTHSLTPYTLRLYHAYVSFL